MTASIFLFMKKGFYVLPITLNYNLFNVSNMADAKNMTDPRWLPFGSYDATTTSLLIFAYLK